MSGKTIETLNKSLIDILTLFMPVSGLKSTKQGVSFENNLLEITPKQTLVPIDVYKRMNKKLSPLGNKMLPLSQIEKFIKEFKNRDTFIGLDHIGFCYKVDSINQEKANVLAKIKKTGFDLYQERATNEAKWLWLFIGSDTRWSDPMVELLPIEKVEDLWLDLWLPHIHIDINTKEKAEDIDKIAIKHFRGNPTPFHAVVIDSYIHIVRLRMGIVSGVNITLDLATSIRKQAYRRANLLRKLS